jgi:hypothetical protein
LGVTENVILDLRVDAVKKLTEDTFSLVEAKECCEHFEALERICTENDTATYIVLEKVCKCRLPEKIYLLEYNAV